MMRNYEDASHFRITGISLSPQIDNGKVNITESVTITFYLYTIYV